MNDLENLLGVFDKAITTYYTGKNMDFLPTINLYKDGDNFTAQLINQEYNTTDKKVLIHKELLTTSSTLCFYRAVSYLADQWFMKVNKEALPVALERLGALIYD